MRGKRIVWASLAAALGLGAFAASGCGRRQPAIAAPAVVDAPGAELERALDRLQRAWAPAAQAEEIASLRERGAALRAPLARILADPGHRRFPAAAMLASALGLTDLRDALVEGVDRGPAVVVAPALTAADELAPFQQHDLADLLVDGTHAQRIAVLDLCRDRAARPLRAIEDLLLVDDAAVVRSALAALPAELSENALQRCIALAGNDDDLGVAALDAIASRRLPRDLGERALEQAFAWPVPVQIAVLGAVAKGTAGDDRMLWTLARSGDDAVRTRALELLDARECTDGAALRTVMNGLSPDATYWVARSLMRAKDPAGLRLLIGLADESAAPTGWAQSAARVLLADVSGIPAANGPDAWRRWAGTVPADHTFVLPDPSR